MLQNYNHRPLDVGDEVRVIDGIVQEYESPQKWQVKHWASIESYYLSLYAGKIGRIISIDGCEEMPFIVEFLNDSDLPFSIFRFRIDEIDSL